MMGNSLSVNDNDCDRRGLDQRLKGFFRLCHCGLGSQTLRTGRGNRFGHEIHFRHAGCDARR